MRGKCIDVTDRQEAVDGFGRRWSEFGRRFHMYCHNWENEVRRYTVTRVRHADALWKENE